MTITPNEISNKDFKKGFRGYDMDEVDTFLDAIREDYEKIYKSNSTLKEQVIVLKEKVEQYSTMESTLQNTLILAQTAAQQAKENSAKEASILIKEAERQADSIIKEAEKRIAEINKEYEFTKQQFNGFKSRFKGMVESQLDTIEKIEIETGILPSPSILTQEEQAHLQNYSKELESNNATLEISNENKTENKTENRKNERNIVKPNHKPDYRKNYKKDYKSGGKKDFRDKPRYNPKKSENVEKVEA